MKKKRTGELEIVFKPKQEPVPVVTVIQKGPSKWRVLYSDGKVEWLPKQEAQSRMNSRKS
jgi:hypothetical protein